MEQIIKAADAPAAIAMVFCCVAIRCVMQAAVDKVQGLYKNIKMCQFWQTWQLTICYTEHRITKCTHAMMYSIESFFGWPSLLCKVHYEAYSFLLPFKR